MAQNNRDGSKNNNGISSVSTILAGVILAVVFLIVGSFFVEAVMNHFFTNGESGSKTSDKKEEAVATDSLSNDSSSENSENNISNSGYGTEPVSILGYNGHVYEIYNEKITAIEARRKIKEGYHLATITSIDEDEVICDMIEELDDSGLSNSTGYWVGADDVETEGEFKWITGEYFTFSKWPEGQPDNFDAKENVPENYLGIWAGKGRNGIWNDFRGDYMLGYILEKEPEVIYESE